MNIHDEIRSILEAYYAAFHARDWEAFAEPLAKGFRYFTDNATIQSRDAFIAFLEKDPWEPLGYSMSDLVVRASSSNDLAFATYLMHFTGISKTKEKTIVALETAVFERIGAGWKMVHFHSSNKVL